ncbi:MAG: hypothetical protein SF052_18575 [Bacteroidia bacterium]|nr:hypothetical protein [Bacteroidia bacterium]
MYKTHYLSAIFMVILIFSGCQTSQQLKVHRNTIQELAHGGTSNMDKFDGLATTIITVLDEATNLSSPYKTYKYIMKFVDQNQTEIVAITTDLESWQANMGQDEKIKFTARSLTKPYSRKMITLVPKVQKMLEEGGYDLGPLEKTLLLFKLKNMVKG